MSGIQRTWSKYKSSLDGPVRTRMDLYKNLPSQHRPLYGILVDIRGEESYDGETFLSGLEGRILFDSGGFNLKWSDHWFVIDIDVTRFVDEYGDVTSIKERMTSGDLNIRVILSYKPPNISGGRISFDADTSHVYASNSSFDAYSIATIVNGLSNQKTKIRRILKPLGTSRYKTAIEVADGRIMMSASGKEFIQLEESGITLSSDRINMQCLPENIIFGSFIRMQSTFMGMIPSTSSFPVSQYVINIPVESVALMKDIAEIMTSIIGT